MTNSTTLAPISLVARADAAVVGTPAGPFAILVDPDGAVLASGFTADPDALVAVVHPTLRPARPASLRPDLGHPTRAVAAYLGGELDALDTVAVRQHAGGEYLAEAWTVLRTVRAGAPVSYARFAALTGRPAAVRAAAQACARNAAALFVPCHRVLRTDGSLGGYRWGTQAKRWLLDFEAEEKSPIDETG